MYIACASVCYRDFREDEIEAMISDAGKAGYRCIELHGPKFWDVAAINAFEPEKMKQKLDEAGLRCTGMYPPGFGGKNDADIEERAAAVAKACEYAKYLGCGFLDATGAELRGPDNSAVLDRVVKMLERVLELTPDSKVLIGLENHYKNAFEQISDYDYVLDRIKNPRIGINVDTGHFHSAGVDAADLIHKYKDRIYGVHIKDHIGLQSVGIGRGEVDFVSVIKALKEIGYERGLTVELEHPDKENTLYYVREALAYLSGLLGQKIAEVTS
jgi:sugar phosphate isomerase/epimerase